MKFNAPILVDFFQSVKKSYDTVRTILFNTGRHKTGTGKRSLKVSYMKVI